MNMNICFSLSYHFVWRWH